MTLRGPRRLRGRMGDAGDDQLSRLRRVHAAAAGADLGDGRDAEHPRGVRAAVGARARRWRRSARRTRSTGTSSSKPRSSPTRISTPTTPIRTVATVPLDTAALESARAIAVRPRQSRSRVGDRAGRPCRQHRRHHRALDRGSLGQHGGVGEQPIRRLRLRPDRSRLRHHPAQPRRAVHAGSDEPERHRAAQAAVQHAVGRLRDARTTAR